MKKSVLSIFLVCCLLVGIVLPFGVLADSNAQLVVSKETAKPGSEVAVSVSTANNPGICALVIGFEYDSSKLEYIGFENGEFSGWTVEAGGNAVWVGDADSSYNGAILKLKFKVLDGASGFASVSVSCAKDGAGNYNEELVAFKTVSGGVEIKTEQTHTHAYTDKVTAPICTEKGYTTHTCSCGDSYKDSYVNALGHSYKDGTCTRCGAKDPGYQPPHTHAYTDKVTAPTCTEKGYTTHTCSCGNSYKDSYVDALGHSYKDGVCTVCGAKDPNAAKPAEGFNDVPTGAYYENAVAWAVERNITGGYPDNTFRPMNTCTRAQIVTFIWRAEGYPEPAGTAKGFTDVKEGTYYYKAVLWAAEQGVTGGFDDGGFHPDELVTRAQAMTFLWRAAGQPAVPAGTVNTFKDVTANNYYYNAVLWAVASGVTGGYTGEQFGSPDGCTRAQIVTFLYRCNTSASVKTYADGDDFGIEIEEPMDLNGYDDDDVKVYPPVIVFSINGNEQLCVGVENNALKPVSARGAAKVYVKMSAVNNSGEYSISELLASGDADAAYTDTLKAAQKKIAERHAEANAVLDGGRACLFDLNGDGVDELVCLYYTRVFERECCAMSIYTISNGQVQTITEKYILAYEA